MATNSPIPFNKPYVTGKERGYISEAIRNGRLSGDGVFTTKCQDWLTKESGTHKALLTSSCTSALEMAAMLLRIESGDEVIMPSFTYVSTANAFVLRGGVPVFVDIRRDTLNLDESLIEAAITPRTRAIVPVHYAGVACDMDTIMAVGEKHGIKVIEDAAHGIMAKYNGRALGTIGCLGTYSFHETKNIISGEGGSLLVNDPMITSRAELIREKGTNRASWFRGEQRTYTWVDIGSSYSPSELSSAFLWAQLESAQWITDERLKIWNFYHQKLESLEDKGWITRPVVPAQCQHNAHLYYFLLAPQLAEKREEVMRLCKESGVHLATHYEPLHSSPKGRLVGVGDELPVTDWVTKSLLRLPLWVGMRGTDLDKVMASLQLAFLKVTGSLSS